MHRIQINIGTEGGFRATEIIAALRNVAETLFNPFKLVGFWDSQADGMHLCPHEQLGRECSHKLPNDDPMHVDYFRACRNSQVKGESGQCVFDKSGFNFSDTAWNQIEIMEKRYDSQLYFHDDFAIPVELNQEANEKSKENKFINEFIKDFRELTDQDQYRLKQAFGKKKIISRGIKILENVLNDRVEVLELHEKILLLSDDQKKSINIFLDSFI